MHTCNDNLANIIVYTCMQYLTATKSNKRKCNWLIEHIRLHYKIFIKRQVLNIQSIDF
jgi:hypothetical protein